ncbi:unnamed protein product, partial [Allacma fusca]
VFGGESKCYQMGQWVTRIKRVSHFSKKSSIRRLKDNENIFVVTNSQNWEIQLHYAPLIAEFLNLPMMNLLFVI